MKALRVLGIILFFLVAIYLVVPLFLADNVIVNQEIDVDAKPATVFRQVNTPGNWLYWSPFEYDATTVNKFSGPEMGVGAMREWKGEEVGEGSIRVLESQPYEYIRNELLFGPGGGGGTGSWNFIESNNITNVTWTIHITNLSYPNNRWMGLFIEMMLEPVMAEGLARLKKRAESLPDPPNIKVVELDVQPSLLIPDSATMEEMEVMLQENFKKLFDYISYMKIPITGQQFSIIHSWNPEGVSRISTGVPVEKDAKPWQDIKYFEIPATKAVFAIHTGGPNTGKTHYAIDDYIKDFGLETKDYVWETYLYDPVMQPDTTQWTTWIYYPLK